MHHDPRDPLGFGQPHVRPGLARIGGLVDAVADGDGVARPGLPGTDPHRARVPRVDGDGSDRLDRLLVEDRHEAGAAVLALPNAATGGADVDQRLAVDVRCRNGGNAAAHGGGPDVARVQAGDDAFVERDLGHRRSRRRLEGRRTRVRTGDNLATDGALRIFEDPVVDGHVRLGLLDDEVRRPRSAFAALVDRGGNPDAGHQAVCAEVGFGDLLAAAHATFVDDADLEKRVRIEEDVLHVAVLQGDADLVRGRAVDVFDAQVLHPASFLTPGDEVAFDVGILGERARVILRGALRLAAAAEWR